MLDFRLSKVEVVSLARKVLTSSGSSSWVLFTEEEGWRWESSSAQKALLYTDVRELFSPPSWYFSVYPTRRPLCSDGGPHFRLIESKLVFMTSRNEGSPGTGERHHYGQMSHCGGILWIIWQLLKILHNNHDYCIFHTIRRT